MKKILLLLNDYPYTFGEYPFIKTELSELTDRYEVEILSTSPQNKQEMSLDKRIKLWHCQQQFTIKGKMEAIMGLLFSRHGWREIQTIILSKECVLGRLYDSISFLGCAQNVLRYIERNKLVGDDELVIYSFWFDPACFAFLLIKDKYPNIKVISRIHGYDLYNERNVHGRQPFKEYMNKQIDKLFFIAEKGKEYYFKHWECDEKDKYRVAFLGTEDVGKKRVASKTESDVFTLISCSNVIALKRVELIVEALALIDDITIHWIHFGTGDLLEKVKSEATQKLSAKVNINYDFKGFVEHEDVIDFYQNNWMDCFITTSSTEGCPVSIQEAMSVGVPIVATSVGEIPNMIQGNGILLAENPSAKEVKKGILAIYNSQDIAGMRKKSRELWEEKYNAHKNAEAFLVELERLFE